LDLAQILMNELHSDRSFPHSGSYPFYRPMSDVPHSKNARNIGLEQEGISVERPSLRTLAVPYKIRTGQQEAALVPLNDSGQPIRPWQCPNKDKHRVSRHTLNLVGIGTKHRNLFQVCFAMRLGDAGMCPKLNVRGRL